MPPKTIRFNIKLPVPLHAQFKAACALRGQTMTDAVVQALHSYIAETNADQVADKK